MFIPRHPVVENQFCMYGSVTSATAAGGIGGVICYAGSVLYLDSTATNQEPIVLKMTSDQTPFGFAMQKVKTGYHQVHPTGFTMPGDLGSSDVIAQPNYDTTGTIVGTKEAPLGVAHLGIWDTVHYTCKSVAGDIGAGDHMKPGAALYSSVDEAKVTNTDTTGAVSANGDRVNDTQVATVLKGASEAKCEANIANTTLYPIRIKLLV